ncbi:hypothetical protein NFX39_05710 [Fructobacillus sp. W13]|uniref:Bacteriocin n=1 Tax=Fructobacillus apis TaxID=2935017 RepID=A0ABT0ZRF3_9LACO|nr:hypothetical protein [Fructobacillus apis]MCO0832574.1 hypothetical protein [Fructobacillus apis]
MKENVLNHYASLTEKEMANTQGGFGFSHVLMIAEFGKGFIDGFTGH